MKCLGVNPPFMQAQSFNLDNSLSDFAASRPEEERAAVLADVFALARIARDYADEQYAEGASAASEELTEAPDLVAALLPWLEAAHWQLSQRRRNFQARLPISLKKVALCECIDRLLSQIHYGLEIAHGRNPLTIPERVKLDALEEQATREADLAALFILIGLQDQTEETFKAILHEGLVLDSASSQYGFLTAAERICALTQQALSALEASTD
jgi:hypothetical protein